MSFVFAPSKCLITTLFFSSDNCRPFTCFTIESPSITVTGSLFFVGILGHFGGGAFGETAFLYLLLVQMIHYLLQSKNFSHWLTYL